ncbi:MipA/OmpV family protein [Trinickia diaoshuihuensis]|uniref:MipA/OmpV family protein n=1 Tax=Trinickia diaoshuihuensis TaxID=2292265 RepID=UPI001F07AFC9|nr:MipA/OmpV family protein [Trinickia diaoshuihuensis]
MKNFASPLHRLFVPGALSLSLSLCLFALSTAMARAEGVDPGQVDASEPGFTILSNATNVTRWGLGAGVGVAESPYKGYGAKVDPLPLVYFDDKWVHVFGTTIDVKVGNWYGLSVSLRGQFSLGDGYKQSDAPILNGMDDRNGSAFWYGPALACRTAFGTLSADYLVGGNKGERASVDYRKPFEFGKVSLTPHAGVQWLSAKYVDYYYGVLPSEALAGRPAYTGRATWNASLGASVDYALTPHQSILLDVGVSRLGGGVTDSPLVGKRFIPEVKAGYIYRFK